MIGVYTGSPANRQKVNSDIDFLEISPMSAQSPHSARKTNLSQFVSDYKFGLNFIQSDKHEETPAQMPEGFKSQVAAVKI